MQGAVIYLTVFTGLIVGISLIFCAVYAFIMLHQLKDDDTEDDLGYLQQLIEGEVN